MREDVKILDKLVENKLITFQEAQHYARLPLVIIPQAPINGVRVTVQELHSLTNQEEPVFEEFSVLATGPDRFDTSYSVIKIKDGRVTNLICTAFPICFLRTNVSVEDNEFVFKDLKVYLRGYKASESEVNTIAKLASGNLSLSLKFLNDCHNQDLYAVGVSKPKEKKSGTPSRKQLISRVSGPSVIFLNKLPQPSTSTGTSTEEPSHTKAPHHRRGHFKTLRDPRFSKHPKYLVERGIYVKPQWIGDRESIVNGTTYTVLER